MPDPSPAARTAAELVGVDVEWVAVDRAGRIGIFTTGGHGPIPDKHLADWPRHRALVAALLALPFTSECRLRARVPRPDDFVACVRRGLFAFDWCPSWWPRRYRYRLQARPMSPLRADQERVPAALRAALQDCASTALDFGRRTQDILAAFAPGAGSPRRS